MNISKWELNPKNLYVGRNRGSKWGNPFVMNIKNSRATCVARYYNYVKNSELFHQLPELLNYELIGCFCAPDLCHCDALLKLLKEIL